MSAEFEQLVAQFEKFQSKIKNADDQLAGLEQMQEEITQLKAVATSADRSITVVAGPGGAINDIQLTDAALKQPPQALSTALMSTLQQAVAEAARKQVEVVEGHLGDDLNLTDQVLETQAQLFGTTPEALKAQLSEQRSTTTSDDSLEDYSQQNIMQTHVPDPPSNPAPSPDSSGSSAGDQFLQNLFNNEEDR